MVFKTDFLGFSSLKATRTADLPMANRQKFLALCVGIESTECMEESLPGGLILLLEFHRGPLLCDKVYTLVFLEHLSP